jgi:hypothetical protein
LHPNLKAFTQKPAIVSVIFSEGIFQFNKELSEKISVNDGSDAKKYPTDL